MKASSDEPKHFPFPDCFQVEPQRGSVRNILQKEGTYMYFKKYAAISAAALLTISLAACASSSPVETLPDLSESRPVVVDVPASESTEAATTSQPTEPADTTPVLSDTSLAALLDSIRENVTPGVAGSSLSAVPYAVELLQWGTNATQDASAIQADMVAYLTPLGNDVQVEFSRQLELVYEMALELLGPTSADVFDSAGVEAVALDSAALNQVNPVLEAVGLETKPLWKVTFENSLYENYGYTPSRYEEIDTGIYTVYVMIDDQEVPYVTVDSATGEYHG